MRVIGDLHIHSKYSRATSKDLDLRNLEKWGRLKGLGLIGTGDFTHPIWIKELKSSLKEDGTGILRSDSDFPFLLSTELSFVYTDLGKGRRIHLVVWAPDFATVDQINEAMLRHGRLDYDGRPIFNLSCTDFVAEMKGINDRIEVIPAHVWTPWFGLFGSMSGYDRIEDCFKDQTKHINALETGLSSDPPMNWRLSALDRYTLLSNSDSHSFWPWRIGREANIFDLKKLTYVDLLNAVKTKDGMAMTVEVNPNYGKYHLDGHRNCGVSMSPQESRSHNDICPVCRKPMTLGVLHRVEELADRDEGFRPKDGVPFCSMMPLSELIAGVIGKGVATKATWSDFNKLIAAFGNEFSILMDTPFKDLEKVSGTTMAEIIMKNREGLIKVKPGFDGEYGVPVISVNPNPDRTDQESVERKPGPQKGLEEFS